LGCQDNRLTPFKDIVRGHPLSGCQTHLDQHGYDARYRWGVQPQNDPTAWPACALLSDLFW